MQFTPPLFLLGSLLIMFAFHRMIPARLLWGPPWTYGGVVAILLGFSLTMVCAWMFYRRKTTIKPFEQSAVLVTDGPYRLSRNPMYLGMVIMLAGMAIVLGTLTPWVVIPAFVWVISRRFVEQEESMLGEHFGAKYRQYSESVRRWV